MREPGSGPVGPAADRAKPSADNVFELGPSLLILDRSRTDRSTCYDEMYERLCDRDRGRVDSMEAKLFQRGLRVAHCPRGTLSLPASDLMFDEGRIWFHFSPERERFVLNYFELWNGGGGFARLPGPRRRGYTACHLHGNVVPDGIAARLAEYFLRIEEEIACEAAASWDPASWHMRCVAALESVVRPRPAVPDFARQVCQAHLVWADPSNGWALPEWSLLGSVTSVRAEIANRYARSIFAGEALCRLSLEFASMGSTGRALAWGTTRTSRGAGMFKAPSSSALLHETESILAAIRDRRFDPELGGATPHFLTASLMDGDLMADQRRLALVRSELTLRLASALVRDAIAGNEDRVAHRGQRRRDLMNRYSMLSDFVSRSAPFFGIAFPDIATSEVVDDLSHCGKRGRPSLRRVVDKLCDYGASTTLIVAYFSGKGRDDVEFSDAREDVLAQHDQLSGLVRGILAMEQVSDR